MTQEQKVQLAAGLDATGVRKGAAEVKEVVRDMSRDVAQQGAAAGRGLEAIGNSSDKAAQKIERADAKIIASLQRRIAMAEAAGKGEAARQEALLAVRGVDPARFRPLLDTLDAVEKKNRAAVASFGQMGISAGQMQNALRGVPAQVTDIVTSLASGQQPLTVMLQQGGQLKDMFGGVGAASRAIGGYLLAAINPTTLLAAAAVGLAAAYYAGSKEVDALRNSVILSGNAAGKTAGQITAIAAAVKAIGAGTQGQASDVLVQLVEQGGVGAENFERFTTAALRLAKVGGPAAAETAKAFASLAREPLQASAKLNESTNFLTRSVAEQIKSLADQGRTTDAARVAQEAYAVAIEQRAPAMQQNLGALERAWQGIKAATLGAVDAAKGIGRQTDTNQQIQALQAEIAAKRTGIYDRAAVPQLEAQLAALQQGAAYEAQSAAEEKRIAEQRRASVQWLREGDAFLSRQQRLERDITQARVEGNAAGAEQADIERRIALLRERSGAGAQGGAVEARRAEAAQLEQIKRAQIDLDARRATGRANERAAIGEAGQLALREIETRRAAVAAELRIVSGRQDAEREAAALRTQLAALDAQHATQALKNRRDLEVATHRQAQAIQAVIDAQRAEVAAEQADYFVQQSKAREAVALSTSEYAAGIADEARQLELERSLLGQTAEARDLRLQQYRIEIDLRKRLAEIDRTPYEDGEAGREAERARVREAANTAIANTAARATLETWRRTSDDIADAITDGLTRGFDSGKSLAQTLRSTLVSMFNNLVLRPTISAAIQPAANAIGTAASSAAGSAIGRGSSFAQAAGLYNNGSTLANLAGGGYASAANYGAVYSGQAYGTAFGSRQSAMLAAQEAGMTSSAGSATSASWAGTAAWVAAAVLGAMKASSDYSAGFRRDQARDVAGTTWGGGGIFQARDLQPMGGIESTQANLLSKLGFSDRLADLLSGSTAVAALFGRAAGRVTSTGIAGTLGAGQFTGAAYADIFEKGGLFRSDKTSTVTAALSKPVEVFMADAAKNIMSKAQDYAKALGLPAQQMAGVATQIRVSFGADAEANKRAITEQLGKYADDLVKALEGQLTPLQQYGETLAQTLERVGTALQGTNDILAALGQAALAASVGGARAAIELQALFGGADAFGQAAGTYLQAFYTDAERTAIAAQQLASDLAAAGVDKLPANRAGYRDLVNAQDLTTASGRETYAALLNLSSAFAAVTEGAEAAAKAVQDQQQALVDKYLALAGDTQAMRQRELAALAPENRALQKRINDLEDAQAIAAQVAKVADALRTAGQGIAAYITELRRGTSTDGGLAAARQAYGSDLTLARLGDSAASERIVASARTLVEQVRATATDPIALARETSRIAGQLQSLPATVSWQTQVLDKLTSIAPALGHALGEARAVLTLTVDSALPDDLRALMTNSTAEVQRIVRLVADAEGIPAALRPLLIEATTTSSHAVLLAAEFSSVLTAEQRAALLAVDETVRKTIDAAVQSSALTPDQALILAQGNELVAKTIQAIINTAGVSDADRQLLTAVAGGTTAQIALTAPDLVAALGVLTNEMKTATFIRGGGGGGNPASVQSASVPAFAAGGMHTGGLRIVGERGAEIEATGPARYWSAGQTAAMMGSPSQSGAVVAELRALRADLDGLRAEAQATATHTSKLYRLQDDMSRRGTLVRTEADSPLSVATA